MGDRNGIRIGNLAVAALTAAALALLVWLFRYPILPPGVWEDVAAGAGLRPPVGVLGGFVRGIYAFVFAKTPDPATALFAIRALGWTTAAVIAFLAYLILNLSHPYTKRLVDYTQGAWLAEGCLAGSCVLFLCNDVVWASVQALSATGLQLTLLLAAIALSLKFFWTKLRRFAFAAMFIFSLLVGETPLAYVGALYIVLTALRIERGEEQSALTNPLARMFFRRVLLLEFFATVMLTLFVEYRLFSSEGGVLPGETALTDFLSTYLGGLCDTIVNAASWKRWILAFLSVVAPFFIALRFYRHDFESDDFLPVHRLAAYTAIGLLAWTQACDIPGLSFRYWLFDRTPMSPLLFALLSLMSVATLLWIALLLGSRLYFDNASDIADFHYEDDRETAVGKNVLSMMSALERWAKPGFAVLAGATLVAAVALRYEPTPRAMLKLVGEYLDETVRECAGLERLVTDGALDAAVELTAFRKGQSLLAMSMTAGQKPREIKLRQRGITAPDDLESLKTTFPNTLRSWIENNSENLKTLGAQLALDAWRNVPSKDRPIVYGVVARPDRDYDELMRTQTWGRDFAHRIIDLYADGPVSRTVDARLREALLFVQFRTARFCQWRAEAAGKREWGDVSREEQALADRLDELNPSYQAAKRMLAHANGMRNVTLTPRENLRLCLRNADFDAAVPFAELVFKANPDDPEANWAIGMHHFQQRNFVHAEPFLANCLKARPDDPAVLNNLAIAEREIGRLDAAERHIREGLERLPDSPHLHRTLDSILKAKGEK